MGKPRFGMGKQRTCDTTRHTSRPLPLSVAWLLAAAAPPLYSRPLQPVTHGEAFKSVYIFLIFNDFGNIFCEYHEERSWHITIVFISET